MLLEAENHGISMAYIGVPNVHSSAFIGLVQHPPAQGTCRPTQRSEGERTSVEGSATMPLVRSPLNVG